MSQPQRDRPVTRRPGIGVAVRRACRPLTPEEDSIPDADEDDIDDSLPADLWFQARLVRAR